MTEEIPKKKIRVAICGIRGIPACYGGFETFAEEISPRLVEKGIDVRVYGRSHVIDYDQQFYKGAEIVLLPAPKHKYLETPVHTILCILHLIFNRVDAVLVCNAANSPFIWLLRIFRIPVCVNVDGIERMRAKWNSLGKLWYVIGEWCSVKFANLVISDAKVIYDYYKSSYGIEPEIITYGHSLEREDEVTAKLEKGQFKPQNSDIFSSLAIEPGKYLLYVSRLEPENNAHTVIDAYELLTPEEQLYPLLIVGDAPYADEYVKGLKASAGEKVVFAGYQFGESYSELQAAAYAYIQATEVGGTHPALVEAMGFGNCVIANETPENLEVLADAGLFYEKNNCRSLSEKFREIFAKKELVQSFRIRARERAQSVYNWAKIANDYSSLFAKLTD